MSSMTFVLRGHWKLGRRSRKVTLVLHIVAAAAWFGMDCALTVLVFTATLAGDPAIVATCLQALRLFAVWPMLAAAVVSLLTGVVLGLGSKYGLVRYWWVTVKLSVNVLMSVLVIIALRPVVTEAATIGEQIGAGTPQAVPPALMFPPIVSPALLLLAYVLSVFKPWGRVRKQRVDRTISRRPEAAVR